MFEAALPATGTVWSSTVQRIRPKPPYEGPDDFEPFAVGYVDLGPVRVESRLDGRPVDEWRIGEPVRLPPGPRRRRPGVVVPVRPGDGGTRVTVSIVEWGSIRSGVPTSPAGDGPDRRQHGTR